MSNQDKIADRQAGRPVDRPRHTDRQTERKQRQTDRQPLIADNKQFTALQVMGSCNKTKVELNFIRNI